MAICDSTVECMIIHTQEMNAKGEEGIDFL